jgi:hypothetical protein
MCFSAGASFIGGTVITAIGVATIKKVNSPAQIPLATVPFIFGIQQISEGFVWVSLQSPGHDVMLNLSAYIFLIAAVVVWPSMIPFSILSLEKPGKKRKTIIVLLALGIITSLYYGIGLLIFNIEPEISSHHICYSNNFPEFLRLPAFFLYLIATLTPLFISSIRKMYLLGIIMALSCLITGIFFKEYLTSVWCFFAAIISGLIYFIIIDTGKDQVNR